MAKMIPLNPAISLDLDAAWKLLATEAGRYSDGLRATVMLHNGTKKAVECFALAQAEQRDAYAQMVAYRSKLPLATTTAKLLDLFHAIEGALRAQVDASEEERHSQATRLVALAVEAGAELFHTPEGEAYATIPMEGHAETWPLRVKGFKRWLARLFYEEEGTAPGAQGLQDALCVLEAKACFDGSEYPVFIRMAEHQSMLHLDLGNADWQCVEMTAAGWQILDKAPVKFRRSRGLLPLPTPEHGGDLQRLRQFVNMESEDDWRLLVSWILAALRPAGPYPVLVIHAEQGAGKSTLCRILRSLVDPNTAGLRTTPRDERDLVIAANNGWLIALDNLSHLPDWLSDALCRLATGSGFATRELYSNDEETIFSASRPIMINGIEELATRGDLLDRSVILSLPAIPEDKRQDEEAFWTAFEAERPKILGALLEIVCQGMVNLPTVQLSVLPRMADFAKWACAVAPACGWTPEDFLCAYQEKREASHGLVLEASAVAPVLCAMLANTQDSQWEGTASELLTTLEQEAQGGSTSPGTFKAASDATKQKSWPKNGRSLSNALRRLAPTLRAVGITVDYRREPDTGRRLITLAKGPGPPGAGTASAGTSGSATGPGRVQGIV